MLQFIFLLFVAYPAYATTEVNTNRTIIIERIVGGSDIPEGTYVPYQVSLQYLKDSGVFFHFCGGSIISPTRILTAAHCCVGMNPTRMFVVSGIRDIEDLTGQRSQVASYIIHPNYTELTTSDIAILQLENAIPLDGTRRAAVNVINTKSVNGGVPVTLTGWGLRLPFPLPFLTGSWNIVNFPKILQTITYTTISNDDCRNMGFSDVTDTEICARGFFKSACSGDSGGPLVRYMDNNTVEQVGIVSYGLLICGGFGVPDAYTRVSTFTGWIQEQLQ